MKRSEYDYAINKYQHRFLHDRLKDLDVSRAEAPYLRKIYKAGGHMLMNDIVGEVFFHKSHTTRAINKLVDEGFIVKEKNPDDLRAFVLSLTEKGERVAKRVGQVLEEWDELVNSVITDHEREMIQNITKKIYHLLREYYNEEGTVDETDI